MDTALKPSAISVIPSLCATLFLTCTGITGFYRSMDKLFFIGMAAGIAVCLYGLWIAVISLEFASVVLDEDGVCQRHINWRKLTFLKRKILWSEVEQVYQSGVVIVLVNREFNVRLDFTDFRDPGAVISLIRRRTSASVADV